MEYPRKREYKTAEGTVLLFRPVSSWTINHLNMKWERCKPLPPLVTTHIEGRPYEEYNENDAKYKQLLSLWQSDKATDMNEAMVRLGILSEPPADFIERYRDEFPDIEEKNIKVHWVYSLLGGENEIQQFFEIIMGQTAATPKGIEEASNSFQGDDRRGTGTDMEAQNDATNEVQPSAASSTASQL